MNRCLSSIIALSAASCGENLLFHLSAIFRFAPRCFQYCQGFVKILNICFHILAVVATTHQFQMGDSGFLQPVQCTKSTSSGTAQIVIPLRKTLFFSDYFQPILPSGIFCFLRAQPVRHTTKCRELQKLPENWHSSFNTKASNSVPLLFSPAVFRAAIMDAISSIVFFR